MRSKQRFGRLAMGDIIRLRPRQGARSEKNAADEAGNLSNGGATILLFLGVQYKRHDDDTASPTKRQPRRNSRRKRA